MRSSFIFFIFFSLSSYYSQDVTNDLIRKVEFRFDDIQYYHSSCNNGESTAEYKIKPYVLDDIFNNYEDFHNPSLENSNNLLEGTCFEESDGDGNYIVNDDHTVFYDEIGYNGSNYYSYNSAKFRIYYEGWESDGCGDMCDYNTGCGNNDDCPVGIIGSGTEIHNNYDVPYSSNHYNNEWNDGDNAFFTIPGGNSLSTIGIDYRYSIISSVGTLSNPFEFGTIDNSGCFSTKLHYFNTDDWGRLKTGTLFYRLTLAHKRSIRIDWSTNTFTSNPNIIFGTQTAGINESDGGGTNEYKDYYNVDAGTYIISIDLSYPIAQTAFSKYKLSISQITVSSPASVIHYWNGSDNQNWFEPCNWSTNHVPNEDNDVIIDNTSNLPRIYSAGNATPDNANGYSAGQAHCNSINIQSGAKVIVESLSFGTAKLNVNH